MFGISGVPATSKNATVAGLRFYPEIRRANRIFVMEFNEP